MTHITRTAVVWLGLRACAADPPLTSHPQFLLSLSGKDQADRIQKSRDVSETPAAFEAEIEAISLCLDTTILYRCQVDGRPFLQNNAA